MINKWVVDPLRAFLLSRGTAYRWAKAWEMDPITFMVLAGVTEP